MKLSICMMVKNEEKNLARCLESLQNLMNSIESELLIVDTGSIDETINIAEKYTKNLFFHKWNDNFSEMRNITISYATAEWLFIIDADEELINDDEIISFLNNKSNHQYAAATLRVENIVNAQGKVTSTLTSPRIFRNTGEFKYKGSVHNIPIFKGIVLELKSTLKHYGYMNDNMELMELKFERTSKLLIIELEKDKNNLYLRYQLGITYAMHGDNFKSNEILGETYKMLMESGKPLIDYIYIIGAYAKSLSTIGYFEKAIEIADHGLSIESDYLDLLFYKGASLINSKNIKEGIIYIEIYLNKLANIYNLPISYNPTIQLYTLKLEDESRLNLLKAYYLIEDFDNALKHAEWLINKWNLESESYDEVLNYYFNLCFKINNNSLINKLYDQFDKEIWDKFDLILYSNLRSVNWKEESVKLHEYSKLKSTLGKLIGLFLSNNNKTFDETDIIELSRAVKSKFSEALYLLIVYKVNISELFFNMDELSIMTIMSNLYDKYSDLNDYVNSYIKLYKNSEDIKEINTKRVLYKYIAIVNLIEPELMINYFDAGINFINQKYNGYFLKLKQVQGYSNSEEQFLSILNWAKENVNDVNKELIDSAVVFFPEWRKSVYIWFDRLLTNNHIYTNEFNDLLHNLKENIITLSTSGNKVDCLLLVKEYLEYCPNDFEILELKKYLTLNIN